MSAAPTCRYAGRDFTEDEIALIRDLIAGDPKLTRAHLSRAFCRRVGWVKPDGGLRDMMARCALLAMHRDGLIVLPPPRHPRRAPGPVVFGPETEPPPSPPPATLEAVRPLSLVPSSTGPATTPCCGSSSSRATIISATSRWPALRCAIPWSTATAPRSP